MIYTPYPSSIYPMGPGFFIFFQDVYPETGGSGKRSGGRKAKPYVRKSLVTYEEQIKKRLDKERAKKLNEQKALERKQLRFEAEKLLVIQQEVRQKQDTELKLLLVSDSLLKIEKELTEINAKRANINMIARIMRDDDEVIALWLTT